MSTVVILTIDGLDSKETSLVFCFCLLCVVIGSDEFFDGLTTDGLSVRPACTLITSARYVCRKVVKDT